jgi:hypothetical protein
MYHRLRIHFRCTRWYSKLTRLKWKLISDYLEIVLILTHCAEHTIGLKIVLDAPDGIPWLRGSCQSCFGPFEDGVSIHAR